VQKESNFSVKDADESTGFLLWQVNTLWQREIKSALEPYSLSHSGFVILASLLWFQEQEIEVTQTTIIEHTKLDKMTVSNSLKTLQKNDFVHRYEHPNDTRAKSISLSEKGMKLAIETLQIVENIDNHFFSKLEKAELELLNSLFVKLK